MKNILWISFFLFFILGCSEDDNTNARIFGTWEWSYEPVASEIEGLEEGDYLFVSQINFSSDNTYESLYFVKDKNSEEVLGYFTQDIGTYNINNNMISLKYDRLALNEENNFEIAPLQDLILIRSNIERNRSFYFENNELILGCGELENCALIPYKKVVKNIIE